MEAVVLAGGYGTRLRGVVPDLPKPMAPVGGRPFLEHQLDYWIAQGVNRFVLSLGYRADVFIRHFGKSYCRAEIAYSIESEPLGTGGGALLATEKLTGDDAFLILNGDTLGDVDLDALVKSHRATAAEMTLALVRVIEGGRYSCVKTDVDGRILEFQNKADKAAPLVNAGIYLVERALLGTLGWNAGERFSIEADGFPRMLSCGSRLFGCAALNRFLDIGVPDDYYRASEFIHNLRKE